MELDPKALLPCPFCGGEADKFIKGLDERFGYADRVTIRCRSCDANLTRMGDTSKGGYADNSSVQTEACNAWNRRALKFGAEHMGCVLEKEECAALAARVRQQEIVRRNPEDFAESYEQPDDLRAEIERLRAELDEFKASNALKGKAFAKASARVKALEEGLEETTSMLDTYVKRVPVGHQPHMMALAAEERVTANRALLDKPGGE